MLENIQSILSTIREEYKINEEEVKKIISKRLTAFYAQLMKSENGTASVDSMTGTLKYTAASQATMMTGGYALTAEPITGGAFLAVGAVAFVGSKLIQYKKGMNKSSRVSEGREAAFPGNDIENVIFSNRQLNREGLKEIVANAYTKQLAVMLLIVYEMKKNQLPVQNESKKTLDSFKNFSKKKISELTDQALDKIHLGSNNPVNDKTSENFNKIFKNVQEIIIKLDDNLNIGSIGFYISGLNLPELNEIIKNINSNSNPSREECIDLIWVIATAKFLLEKKEEHKNSPPKVTIIHSLIQIMKEPIYNEIKDETLSTRTTPRANPNRYVSSPTTSTSRCTPNQAWTRRVNEQSHLTSTSALYVNSLEVNNFTHRPSIDTSYDDVYQPRQNSAPPSDHYQTPSNQSKPVIKPKPTSAAITQSQQQVSVSRNNTLATLRHGSLANNPNTLFATRANVNTTIRALQQQLNLQKNLSPPRPNN
ncbi:MAG: hypothetical protein AAGB33_00065 [Cellulomonas sp.]|nr:hypothetical protein [Rickettsiella sp.]